MGISGCASCTWNSLSQRVPRHLLYQSEDPSHRPSMTVKCQCSDYCQFWTLWSFIHYILIALRMPLLTGTAILLVLDPVLFALMWSTRRGLLSMVTYLTISLTVLVFVFMARDFTLVMFVVLTVHLVYGENRKQKVEWLLTKGHEDSAKYFDEP